MLEDFYSGIDSNYVRQIEEIEDERLKGDIVEFISAVPFAYNLISRHRKRAKDLEKDDKGKIKVDLINPHILEDMDYFRERALYFKKHKCYTELYPNTHPQSEWMQFWKEEKRRCLEGHVRESDGEWITGYHYWYLNYCPIQIAVSKNDDTGEDTVAGERIEEFPLFWDGDYIYFHYLEQARNKGKHGSLLKTRGRGYSFKGGAILANNYFLEKKGTKAYAMASMEEFLTTDGLLNKTWDILNFVDNNTAWTQPRDYADLDLHKKASYKDPETKTEKGKLTEVIGVTLRNDPNKARGKRGRVILWEEAGKFPGLLTSWTIAKGSMQQGRTVYGQMVAFGTGGTEGADFEAMEALFYDPESYGVMALPNVFDRNQDKVKCALYIGEYLNREFCYDENGNSNVIKALKEILSERRTLSANALVQHKADYSLTPQEAVMRKEGTLYPVADLKDYLATIAPKINSLRKEHHIGRLKINEHGSVIWSPEEVKLITNFPLKDNKYEGGLEIFSQPKKTSDGIIPWGRYIAGLDPFDDDYSTTTSLGSMFLYDTLLDEVVAEYTGRPQTANEFYETVRRILIYYNAICNYENFNKGIFGYFSNKNCLHFLCDTPKILKSMEFVKGESFGNKAHPYSEKVYTPTGIKKWGEIKIGDCLYGTNNNITKVIDIPFDNETDIYEITLKDGRKIKASENHLWNVIEYRSKEKTISTKEMLKKGLIRKKGKYNESRYYIPINKGIEFEEQRVLLDPYFLGLMLGDGCFTASKGNSAYFTSSIEDLEEYMKILKYEYKTYDDRHHRIKVDGIRNIFRVLNLHDKKRHTKFIPDIYKYNSRKIRTEILQGLMDSDGTIGYGGKPQFTNTSKFLCEGLLEIARSLGINGNISEYKNEFGSFYTVRFYTEFPMFKLKRKLNKQRVSKTRHFKTGIVDIKLIGKERAKCVTVDSEDSCYLIGDFVTTHNSKGTPPSKAVNAYSRRLAADWLMQPVQGDESGRMNLHKLRSVPLIQEFIGWNPDGNFDRERAFGMLMILKEDRAKIIADPTGGPKDAFTDSTYWKKYASKSYKDQGNLDMKNETFNFKNGLFKL